MIGLLDPALLLPRPVGAQQALRDDIDRIIRLCRRHAVALLPFDDYWPDLWLTLGRELERQLPSETKRSLQELRKLADGNRPQAAPQPVDVWRSGFDTLFGEAWLPPGWVLKMARAAARAVATDPKVVLLTRRMVPRNLTIHTSGHVTLHEVTRWVLYLQVQGSPVRNILCVHDPRNITQEWTVRFDPRLPATEDGARFPFCPPQKWWKRQVESFRTVAARPAWLDCRGNGWSRPNIPTGAGYHWDVTIRTPALEEATGLDQINVVEFGCSPAEGQPGQLHHVPTKKAGNIKVTAGWACPQQD